MTRTPEQVRKILRFKPKQGLTKEVLGFAVFMLRQQVRLNGRSETDPKFGVKLTPLGPRDVVKAAVLTGSSIMRGSIALDTALARWPRDLPLPDGYETETLADGRTGIRPETFMALLLMSPLGTRFLDAAERGVYDEESAIEIARAFKPFGLSGLEAGRSVPKSDPKGRGPIYEFVDDIFVGGTRREEFLGVLQRAASLARRAEYGLSLLRANDAPGWVQFVERNIYSVGIAKAGFIGSLLGWGQLPTADARELKLWYGSSAIDVTKAVVKDLATKLDMLDIQVPQKYQPFYQHLVHHLVWDAAGEPPTKTSHADVVAAMELA